MENKYINKFFEDKFFEDAKIIINETIYKILLKLLFKIFLKFENSNTNNKILKELEKEIEYINIKIIKKKENFINYEYEKKNLNNIFNLVKMQNSEYAGEIIENLLIIVFIFAFKIKK